MKGIDAYKKYVAIKLHFQTNYDYFKFSGKAKASRHSYETRRDKHIFDKLAKIYDSEQYELLLVANFLDNKNVWIGDIATDVGRQRYLALKKKLQSLQHHFKEDMLRIKEEIDTGVVKSFDEIFSVVSDESCWPHLIEMMMQQDISIETFIIMNKILNFLPKMGKLISDDLVWPEVATLISKYSPFVRVDLKPFRAIMKSTFLSSTSQKTLDART